jgi:lipopolysaccharide biosynthesis glycosyltransferase
MDGDISEINKSKLERIVKGYNGKVTFLKIDKKIFENFRMNKKLNYITIETYYRIMIPDLLSNDISKALYLDSDIIVESDIDELWNTDITNYYLAAVDEIQFHRKRSRKLKDLSLPRDSNYFNAGVLLLNLEKWRENEVPKQLIKYIDVNPKKLKFFDQDALNVVLHDKWLPLDPKWNYLVLYCHLKNPLEIPAIIHFAGTEKPWNAEIPFKENYLKYLRNSLWDQKI